MATNYEKLLCSWGFKDFRLYATDVFHPLTHVLDTADIYFSSIKASTKQQVQDLSTQPVFSCNMAAFCSAYYTVSTLVILDTFFFKRPTFFFKKALITFILALLILSITTD